MEEQSFGAGENLMVRDEPGDHLFVLTEGQAQVLAPSGGGEVGRTARRFSEKIN